MTSNQEILRLYVKEIVPNGNHDLADGLVRLALGPAGLGPSAGNARADGWKPEAVCLLGLRVIGPGRLRIVGHRRLPRLLERSEQPLRIRPEGADVKAGWMDRPALKSVGARHAVPLPSIPPAVAATRGGGRSGRLR